ncbi:MAG: hypothetical protein PVS2B2_15200 [Candidatus Acidiferrum sp.]
MSLNAVAAVRRLKELQMLKAIAGTAKTLPSRCFAKLKVHSPDYIVCTKAFCSDEIDFGKS